MNVENFGNKLYSIGIANSRLKHIEKEIKDLGSDFEIHIDLSLDKLIVKLSIRGILIEGIDSIIKHFKFSKFKHLPSKSGLIDGNSKIIYFTYKL